MKNREALRQRIEYARAKLNEALGRGEDIDECYELSKRVDELIEDYIDFCEGKKETIYQKAHIT